MHSDIVLLVEELLPYRTAVKEVVNVYHFVVVCGLNMSRNEGVEPPPPSPHLSSPEVVSSDAPLIRFLEKFSPVAHFCS